jgi:predicted dienelactone hydrolase
MRLSSRLTATLAVLALAPSAASAASPYEKGPAPTVASVRATAGPYGITRTVYQDSATPGFGAATVFAPANSAGQTFGAVAFAPGFTETTSSVSWLAQRVASFGFVTIAFNVNNTFLDFPAQRADQLLAALDFVKSQSKERALVDPNRLAVSGHSMGGGATLEASRTRPSLKAAVGLEPWYPNTGFGDVTVPSLEIGAQFDIIAPVSSNARVHARSLPATTPKAYAELAGADHFVSNSPSAKVGAATVTWLKRFVDDDERYTSIICGARLGIGSSELSAFASNCPTA